VRRFLRVHGNTFFFWHSWSPVTRHPPHHHDTSFLARHRFRRCALSSQRGTIRGLSKSRHASRDCGMKSVSIATQWLMAVRSRVAMTAWLLYLFTPRRGGHTHAPHQCMRHTDSVAPHIPFHMNHCTPPRTLEPRVEKSTSRRAEVGGRLTQPPPPLCGMQHEYPHLGAWWRLHPCFPRCHPEGTQ